MFAARASPPFFPITAVSINAILSCLENNPNIRGGFVFDIQSRYADPVRDAAYGWARAFGLKEAA